MNQSSPEIPKGPQSGEVGMYTFFYLYNTEKGAHCDRWICDIFALTKKDAREQMLMLACLSGIGDIDDRFFSLRFMHFEQIEKNMLILEAQFEDHAHVEVADADMTLTTEVIYQQRLAKNSLIKTLIDAKSIGLYERHKQDLSDEERLYVLNKIR